MSAEIEALQEQVKQLEEHLQKMDENVNHALHSAGVVLGAMINASNSNNITLNLDENTQKSAKENIFLGSFFDGFSTVFSNK